jgi:hypothetical protein
MAPAPLARCFLDDLFQCFPRAWFPGLFEELAGKLVAAQNAAVMGTIVGQ